MNKKLIGIIATMTICSTVTAGLTLKSSIQAKATTASYTWNNVKTGAGGGFIPGIIFNQKQKDLIYTRTDMGGAYRWNAATSSWTPLLDWIGFDDWNLTGCESLATDSVDPNRVYIAAGTYTNDWAGNGAILRSTDKGNTWQKTDLPFKIGGNMPGRSMGERLSIDPNNNKVLYLGTHNGNGLWRSTDYGVTWSKVTSFTATGNYIDPYFNDSIGIVWVTFDPSTGSAGNTTQTIYVGVADTNQSIYKSTDGGATWQPVANQPTKTNQTSWKDSKGNSTGYLPHHGVISNGNLYITYSDTCGPYDGDKGDVWKYNTKTGAWTNISPVLPSSSDDYFGYGGLAVDAEHPDTIMVTTLNSWWPDAQIYRSTNGGATWSPIWSWNGYPNRDLKYTQDISAAPWLDWGVTKSMPETSPKLGWMNGTIAIDPFNSDRMMYGTGATIYGSDNLTNWDKGSKINISVKASGIEEASVNTIISPPSGANLLSGMGDISGFKHDDLTKAPSKMLLNPSFNTTSMDFAEKTPNFIVRTGNVSDDDYKNGMKSISFSYDGGSNWFTAQNMSGITSNAGGTVAAASDASVVVWSAGGTAGKVAYSKDNGNSWIASVGVPAGAKVVSDRVNPKKFYAFYQGKFYVSTDAGANFKLTVSSGLPTTGTGNFSAVAGHEGDIWLTGGSTKEGVYGLWHSTDSGATFQKVSNVQAADAVGFGKAAPNQTYPAIYTSAKINNVRGFYRSDDGGATWVRINDDKHQYGSTNIAIIGDPRIYGRVYIATNGRGVVYGDISTTN
ncbi:sialidase family protein [Clostridium sp. C8-1-8]|uniref:sialidase family protein n=1 Tax=Clostridium sp. C8-1-8 TaxID=2698831 RepID=UPI00136E8829|nr:sialidase family protein [Clostridium sp. C8-1-8]